MITQGIARARSALDWILAALPAAFRPGFWPPVEASSQGPENDHADDGAGGVDEDVGDECGAGGDEDLMDFVGGGVEEDDENCDEGLAPAPGAGVAANGFADGAPEEYSENGVFGEVRAFADDVMDAFDVSLGHVGEKPVQEGFD